MNMSEFVTYPKCRSVNSQVLSETAVPSEPLEPGLGQDPLHGCLIKANHSSSNWVFVGLTAIWCFQELLFKAGIAPGNHQVVKT